MTRYGGNARNVGMNGEQLSSIAAERETAAARNAQKRKKGKPLQNVELLSAVLWQRKILL